MKITMKITDESGRTKTKTAKTRNLAMFEAMKKTKSQTFRPKKGAGSYNRQQFKKF